MSATFSFEARLSRHLRDWNMSLSQFEGLVALSDINVRKSRLAQALRGAKALDNETTRALEPLLASIDALVKTVRPLKIDMGAPAGEIYTWVQQYQDGLLKISIEVQS